MTMADTTTTTLEVPAPAPVTRWSPDDVARMIEHSKRQGIQKIRIEGVGEWTFERPEPKPRTFGDGIGG